MGSTGVGVFGGLRRTTVLKQTAAGMVALIVLAIAAAALPAYALIYAELERQAWDHVESGAATSEALIEAELDRLANAATPAAQRPTLRALAADGRAAQKAERGGLPHRPNASPFFVISRQEGQ